MSKFSIHESRRLTLPIEAVVDAVLDLDHERGGWLSVATVVEASVDQNGEGALVLALQPPGADTIDRRRYSLPAIAAAVIHYCWRRRIPLPRNWTKRIEIVPEGFAFSLQGSTEMQSWHGARSAAAPLSAIESASTPASSPPVANVTA